MNLVVNVRQYAFRYSIGTALLLCLLTYLLFEHAIHYENVSGELLVNPAFNDGLVGWRSSRFVDREQVGTIDLSNRHPSEIQSIWQVIPVPHTRAIRLTAVYSLKGVAQGVKTWHNARLSVGGRRHEERWRWNFRGTVFGGSGTVNLGQSTAIVQIPEDLDELRIEFALGGGTGEFRVHKIETAMVRPINHIEMLIDILKLCWAVLGVIVMFFMISRGLWMIFPAVGLLMFLLVFIPKSMKEHLLFWSREFWATFSPSTWQIDFDHLVLFMLLSIFVESYLRLSKIPISGFRLLISLLTVAISLEILQYYIQYRRVNFGDAIVNMIGVVIPLGLSQLLFGTARRRTKSNDLRRE